MSAPKPKRLAAVELAFSFCNVQGEEPTLYRVSSRPSVADVPPPVNPVMFCAPLHETRIVDALANPAGSQLFVVALNDAGEISPIRSNRPNCKILDAIETVEHSATVGCGPPGLVTQISFAPLPPPVPNTSVTSPPLPPAPVPIGVQANPFHQQTTFVLPPAVLHVLALAASVT